MKTAIADTRALVVKAYASGVATRKQLAEIFDIISSVWKPDL